MKTAQSIAGVVMEARRKKAFTLIELLVVIGIITLLLALVTPAVMTAMSAGRAVNSMSNLRQWGIALNAYMGDHRGVFPWDGHDSVADSLGSDDWWANALPPYVGCEPYRTLAEKERTPLPPSHSIFLDPSARVPASAPYRSGSFQYFFCYVPNSKLDSSLPASGRVCVDGIPRPCSTVFMVEMRTHPDELPASHPFRSKSLDRAKADWQRFANRHRQGGHIVFGDGHVQHVTQEKAITQTGGDYNQDDLVWNPFGAAR